MGDSEANTPSDGEGVENGKGSEGDSLFDTIIGWFTMLINRIVEGFENVENVIDKSINLVVDRIGSIVAEITVIFDSFFEKIKELFVPSEGFMDEKVNALKAKFKFVTNLMDIISALSDSLKGNGSTAPSFEMNVSFHGVAKRVKLFDLAWYASYKQYGDSILRGIMIVGFIWRTYVKLPNIISGVGGSVGYISRKGGD